MVDGISDDYLAYWISTFRNASQFEEAGWDFVVDLNILQAEAVEIANSVIVCSYVTVSRRFLWRDGEWAVKGTWNN